MRFPEFTEPWKKVKLGELAVGFDYGMNAPATEFDGVNKYIRITDIDEKLGTYSNKDIVSPNGKLEDRYRVKDNDILLARTGASVGKSYLYTPTDGVLYYAGFLIRLNVIHANPKFIYSLLQTPTYKRWVGIMSARSGQPGINSQEYASYSFAIPSDKEQYKIARLLSLLDERITTQNKIIDNLQSLIKGLAATLTSQEKPNTEITNCLVCHSSTLQEGEIAQIGIYPAYGASGIVGYTNDAMIEDNAILIIKDGSGVGTVSYVKENSSVLGTLNYLTAKGEYHLRYLYYALMSFNFEPYKTGMAIPHIYFKDYGRAKIWCPERCEQIKIAKALSTIEDKMKLEIRLLRNLQLQKSFLLGMMFI